MEDDNRPLPTSTGWRQRGGRQHDVAADRDEPGIPGGDEAPMRQGQPAKSLQPN